MTEVQTAIKYPYLSSDSVDSDLADIAWGLMKKVYEKLRNLGYDPDVAYPKRDRELSDLLSDVAADYSHDAAAAFVIPFNDLIAKRFISRIELSPPFDAYFKDMEFDYLDNNRPEDQSIYDVYVFNYKDADKARQLAEHGDVARQLSEMTGVPCVVFYFEAHGDPTADEFIDRSHPDIEIDRGD